MTRDLDNKTANPVEEEKLETPEKLRYLSIAENQVVIIWRSPLESQVTFRG